MKLTRIYLIVCYIAQLRAEQFEGMIVGGQLAKISHYPHSVFLRIMSRKDDQSWLCGGSIVNQNIILTAGHCLDDNNSKYQIQAYVGSEQKQKGSLYTIDRYVLHEGYVVNTSENDLGLLKTTKAIRFSNVVGRVALMKTPPYFEDATVSGWGLTDEVNGIAGNNLKFLAQKVWHHSDCVKVLKFIPKGTICASADSPLEFAAKGDSGSALVVRGYIQIGIVSYKNILKNNLIVYTDIGYFYKWIKRYAKNLYCF